MHNATPSEINNFLRKVRTEVARGRFVLVQRCDITKLGLTVPQVKDEIIDLRLFNYDRGPTPDHNRDGTDIWEFGKVIGSKMVYIKIKLDTRRGCVCLSFKESEGPWKLPYRHYE